MSLKKNPVWRWYCRHDDVIKLIITSTVELLPAGEAINKLFEFIGAGLTDKEEADDKNQRNQNQQKIAELLQLLTELKPDISDLVEEIEDLTDYQKGMSQQDFKQTIINGDIKAEFDKIHSKLKKTITRSIMRLQQQRIINNKYELGERIGEGAQGIVYKGRELFSDRWVAIKLLPIKLNRDARAIAKIRKEYHLVSQLRHQFIVTYTDFGQDSATGEYYLIMDYIDGQSLGELIDQEGPFTLKESLKYLCPIAEALDFSHQVICKDANGKEIKGVVHRDIKPDNILINQQGQPFLTDFGLAAENSHTLTTVVRDKKAEDSCGTMPYMAPEQYRSEKPKASADNWAFGVVLYEMLTGRMPFNGFGWHSFKDVICKETPEKIAESILNKAQWQSLLMLLAKDRKQRPFLLTDFLNQLVDLKEVEPLPFIVEEIVEETGHPFILEEGSDRPRITLFSKLFNGFKKIFNIMFYIMSFGLAFIVIGFLYAIYY